MSSYLLDRILDNSENTSPDDAVIAIPRATRAVDESPWDALVREGELAIDVYQTPQTLVVRAVIAGAKSRDISVDIQNDVLTIRGVREMDERIPDEDYIYRECFWGPFSRSVVLPVEVVVEEAKATFQSGILKIILPKAARAQATNVPVIEEREDEIET